jgi:hypothetical protein
LTPRLPWLSFRAPAPAGGTDLSYVLRAGATLNHVEIEDGEGETESVDLSYVAVEMGVWRSF